MTACLRQAGPGSAGASAEARASLRRRQAAPETRTDILLSTAGVVLLWLMAIAIIFVCALVSAAAIVARALVPAP